jgi:hypothetical protein
MKQINNYYSLYNIFHRNAETLKDIEKSLWAVMAEIKLNNENLKTNKSCVKMINRKYELEKAYQHLSNLYCFSDPFTTKEIVIN